MASNQLNTNPKQSEICQLISQRFSGRKGDYNVNEIIEPKNSTKTGISNDPTILPIFTSNYILEDTSINALKKLSMFQNLKVIEMLSITGKERYDFAKQYLYQYILLDLVKQKIYHNNIYAKIKIIRLDIPIDDGDTRPLIRHLRMVGFYTRAMIIEYCQTIKFSVLNISIIQKNKMCSIVINDECLIDLYVGSLDNLFPKIPKVYNLRSQQIISKIQNECSNDEYNIPELSIILDFWLTNTLAPAVILSNDKNKVNKIIESCNSCQDIHCISQVNVNEYKMMKSLYDSNNTPNLRDDILNYGRGANVIVGLICNDIDAQYCIREIIEDTPSMTAFSSTKSALYKDGILFVVYVKGEITPEVKSRASLII